MVKTSPVVTLGATSSACLGAAFQTLAVQAPDAVDAIDGTTQGPTGADLADRDIAADFYGQALGPVFCRTFALKKFFIFKDHRGIENWDGEYCHGNGNVD